MEEEGLNQNYQLSQSLFKHSGATRAVALYKDKMLTGGIDKKVNLYQRKGENSLWEFVHEFKFFKDYIYSIAGMDDDRFVVGCKDGKVYVCGYHEKSEEFATMEGKFVSDSKCLIM